MVGITMTHAKDALAARYAVELSAMARDVIATNSYFVLCTAHSDGHPRVSPVYFNHHEHHAFYWVSSPHSQHSRNLAGDPRMSAVIFDSSAPPPETRAVYLIGTAAEVPETNLTDAVPNAFLQVRAPAKAMSVEDLTGDSDLRLYRLDVHTAEVHARGGHPVWGMGIDTRLRVAL